MKTYQQFQEDIDEIIKGGITTFINKNKNVSVGDFINPNTRKKTLKKVTKRGKNTFADTLSSLSKELKK
tara:strand:+ start:41 stop:247 length:207 start_codon:yes stop_codon:yes gene_type:complete